MLDKIAQENKVLILGFAREGQSSYKFLRARFPDLHIVMADMKTPDWIPEDPNITFQFGDSYLDILTSENCQLVIKSPGISPHIPEIVEAKKQGVVFTSHTQMFFEVCPGQIIGITGTKGKSTTASLIYHVIHECGLPTVLVGNIGQPALDHLTDIHENTWIVMELSSYQLMDLTISPHITVLQNIFPDHLDYHSSFEEYVEAKRNAARFQKASDYFIFNSDFPLPAQTADLTPAQKIPYSISDFDPSLKTQLIGQHNRYNILPALIISKILNLPEEKVNAAISGFTPLNTRLQEVGTTRGIRFFEDTLATIPEATIAAIDALHPLVETLIAGGHERKQNYLELAKKILSSNIKTLIVFPATGPRIWEEIQKVGSPEDIANITYIYTESMSEAVSLAMHHTVSGKICLLSPAAPSFTLFTDYRDEGQQYRNAINQSVI